MPGTNRTIKLKPYRVYPTYQLWGLLGSRDDFGRQDEQRLVRAICKTYSWLADRFRQQDLPEELTLPEEPRKLADFKSFSIFEGYQIEALCLAGRGSWSIRLVEADLGSGGGQAGQLREAVPGRLFYTDIAFRLLEDRVEAGIRVQVSEPAGTGQDCPVYRPAIVRWLAEDLEIRLSYACESPIAGDSSTRPLCEVNSEPVRSDDRSLVSWVQAWLADPLSFQPLLLVTEAPSEEEEQVSDYSGIVETPDAVREASEAAAPMLRNLSEVQARSRDYLCEPLPLRFQVMKEPVIDGEIIHIRLTPRDNRLSTRLAASGRGRRLDRPCPEEQIEWAQEDWIRRLAAKQLGFGPVLILNPVQRIQLNSRTGLQIPGDSLTVIRPAAAGEEPERLSLTFRELGADPDAYLLQLSNLVRNRLRGETQSFREVLLPDESREQQLSARPVEGLSAEIQLKEALSTIEQFDGQLKKHQQRNRAVVTGLKGDLSRMKRRLKDAESNYTDLQGKFAHEQMALTQQLRKTEEQRRQIAIQNAYLRSLGNRPRAYDGIAAWMERHGPRLILHHRARDELAGLAPNTVDLTLLLDALEYLAVEWLDWRLQKCTEAERDQNASLRYGRGFDVTRCDSNAVEMFVDDYHVSFKGARLQLNYHLKVGNRSPNLLRIYFCELPGDGRLLIGSLPAHLRTLSDPH